MDKKKRKRNDKIEIENLYWIKLTKKSKRLDESHLILFVSDAQLIKDCVFLRSQKIFSFALSLEICSWNQTTWLMHSVNIYFHFIELILNGKIYRETIRIVNETDKYIECLVVSCRIIAGNALLICFMFNMSKNPIFLVFGLYGCATLNRPILIVPYTTSKNCIQVSLHYKWKNKQNNNNQQLKEKQKT